MSEPTSLPIEDWQETRRLLQQSAKLLKCKPDEVASKARALVDRVERLEVEVAEKRRAVEVAEAASAKRKKKSS